MAINEYLIFIYYFFYFTLGVWDCTEKGFSGIPADLFLFSIIIGGGLG